MSKTQVHEERSELLAQARGITDNDELSTAEKLAKVDDIYAQIDALEERQKQEDALAQRATELEDRIKQIEERNRSMVPVPEERAVVEKVDSSKLYDQVFTRWMKSGLRGLNGEERAILSTGQMDDQTEERAVTAGTAATGGNAVPDAAVQVIERKMKWYGSAMEFGRVINSPTGRDLPVPVLDPTSLATAAVAEAGAAGFSTPAYSQIVLKAYKYGRGIQVDQEFLTDAVSELSTESLFWDLLAEGTGRTLNQVLTTGTGSSAPQGVVTGATVGLTTASATALKTDEILALPETVDFAYRQSPCHWMFHRTLLQDLRTRKDGQNNYLWQMGDVRLGEPNMLWGYPYLLNNDMDSTFAANKQTLLFGCGEKFLIRMVGGYRLVRLDELYAVNDQVGFVLWVRIDSKVVNSDAIKVAKQKA